MKTEISYDELVNAYAPLWDASRMIERLKENIGGGGFADEFFTAWNSSWKVHKRR